MNHKDRCAPECDDQLPIFAVVGRGPKGDSSYIEISEPDTCDETYLHGWTEDSETGEMKSEWYSRNINGGRLMYYYTTRPYTDPRTFTITFKYFRPGHDDCTWSWTTPAIPYIWSLDDAGKPQELPDHIVGSGIATQYIKTMSQNDWHETLHYPKGTTGEDFNSPKPEEAWSSTIRFGLGGDIEIPDYDEIARIVGVSKETIIAWLKSKPAVEDDGMGDAYNIKEYIDQCDQRDMNHIHADLGFCGAEHGTAAFGGENTVKAYIDKKISQAVANIKNDIAGLIHGATVVNGDIVIPVGTKIPTGNLNIYSTNSKEIRTHAGNEAGDLKTN